MAEVASEEVTEVASVAVVASEVATEVASVAAVASEVEIEVASEEEIELASEEDVEEDLEVLIVEAPEVVTEVATATTAAAIRANETIVAIRIVVTTKVDMQTNRMGGNAQMVEPMAQPSLHGANLAQLPP